MAQISGQGRWLIRLIVVKKLLLAGVLLCISLVAVLGDVHYAELSDFAETWGNADRQFQLRWPRRDLCWAPLV